MKCAECGGEAMVLLTSVECSNLYCRHFNWNQHCNVIDSIFPFYKERKRTGNINSIVKHYYKQEELKVLSWIKSCFIYSISEHIDGIEYVETFHFERNAILNKLKEYKKYKESNPETEIHVCCERCSNSLFIKDVTNAINLFDVLEEYKFRPYRSENLEFDFMLCNECTKEVKKLEI